MTTSRQKNNQTSQSGESSSNNVFVTHSQCNREALVTGALATYYVIMEKLRVAASGTACCSVLTQTRKEGTNFAPNTCRANRFQRSEVNTSS